MMHDGEPESLIARKNLIDIKGVRDGPLIASKMEGGEHRGGLKSAMGIDFFKAII